MNFEQNFNPLDTESQEYQSLNITPLLEPISSLQDPPIKKVESVVKVKRTMDVPIPTQIPTSSKTFDEGPVVTYSKKNKTLKTELKGAEPTVEEIKLPLQEMKLYYDNWRGSSDYINKLITEKLTELDGGGEQSKPAADALRGVLYEANKSIREKLPQGTELVYNLLSDFSDLQTNEQTRSSFITAYYAPQFFSKSKALLKEHGSSEFKDVLTPRQYSGLKSLSYGKQGEFGYYIGLLTDPKSSEADKNIAKLTLDKIGTGIDITASTKMVNDAAEGKLDKSYIDSGKNLFISSRDELPQLDEKIRQIEFENPYNLSVTKSIFDRAIDRGIAMGASADILNISSNIAGIDVNILAELQRIQQEARASKAFEQFYENPTFENFSKNPLGILMELSMESLTAMYYHGSSRMAAGAATGAAIGSAFGGLGAIPGAKLGVIGGMGLTSLNLEFSSEILQGIAEAGYDTTKAEDLRKAFQDEELMNKLKSDGYKKGIPVGLFDMLSMGVAGKLIKGGTTVTGKILRGTGEIGIQMGTGAAGEATSQIIKSGKVYSQSDILMEALGEIATGAPEIAFGAIGSDAKKNKPTSKRNLAIVIDGLGLEKADERIDVLVGSGQITEKKGTELKAEVRKAFEQMQKMPSLISTETKSRIMDLVEQRDKVLQDSQNLDDVFKKQAQKQAELINEEILKIANDDINSQQKQKEDATKESSGTQQEVVPEGGVSQYPGTQEVQDQTPTEADNRNRPVSGTQEVAFQKEAEPVVANINAAQVDNIAANMNTMEGAAVEFKVDDAVKSTVKANTADLISRPQNAVTPKVVKVSDFIGKPIMVTISDELTTGDVVNPATGNTISGLMGGIGFNYTPGNTNYAWAYTDETTATDTLNAAKEIYRRNPELYPDGIVPVAVVKMGTEAINSNEAVFRVLLDNVNSLPKANLKNAYSALVDDIKVNMDRLVNLSKKKSLSPSERNALNGYTQIYNEFLKENKSIQDVVANVSKLNINTRPLIMDRITAGEVGLLPDVSRLRADKPVTKALMNGLGKEDIKKIHLGWITEPLRDASIKNVPARHVIGFVGIDAKAPSIEKSGHPNYPFALKGMGLGVVEDTVHLASIMPTAYGNAVKKITDAISGNKTITPAQAVSRAMPSGLANAIFRGKNIVEQESNLSQIIGFLNLSFPNVTFFTDQQSFDDIISSPDVKKYLKDGEIVYGLTTDGKIYLNPTAATANTAIHEMGHIWVDYTQNNNPELFNKGLELVEGTDEFIVAKKQLGDNINARKEALARLIGNRGETITSAAQKSKFKEWLVAVWKYLQEQFPSLRGLKPSEIEKLTLEQFIGGALKDILSGQTVSETQDEYVNIGEPAQKMSDIPEGEPERQIYDWEIFRSGQVEQQGTVKTSTGKEKEATVSMVSQIDERDRTIKEIKKATPSLLSKISSNLKIDYTDNQYNVLRLLESIGRAGEIVKTYLVTRNSASATAVPMAEEYVKNIFGDFSKRKKYEFNGKEISEYVLFNQVIGYQRVISIQNQMDETYRLMKFYEGMIKTAPKNTDVTDFKKEYNKNKKRLIENNMINENGEYVGNITENEFSLGQVTATQAFNLLNEIRSTIGEEDFSKMMNKSKEYSDVYNDMMKSRYDAGLITLDTYQYLSRFFYAPTRYISSVLSDPILSMSRPTVSYNTEKTLKIKKLKGGSERLNASDYEGLLKSTIYASEYSIAENRTTNRFYQLVNENPVQFEEAGIRSGTSYLKIDDNNRNLNEDISDDFIDDDGNRYITSQIPLKEGEEYIKTYFNGQRRDLIVPKWFAEAWNNDNQKSSTAMTWLGKITGANLLRIVATGINPVFGIAQLVPDSISAYAATIKYRGYMPLLVDYPVFFTKTLLAARDIKSNSKDYVEAQKYGATTNFYNGGSVSFERGLLGKEDRILEKVIEDWNVPGLKQYIIGSKKITETTEQMSKVALYKSIRDSKINEYILNNGVEPTGIDLEDIRIEAGFAARSTADFHRKGAVGSELNKVIPYLNAAIQIQRAVIGSAKQNKLKTLFYTMEFAGYTTLLLMSAIGMGDDDELKEKKRLAYSKWSDFDKENRIPIYFVESENKFISIKIPSFLVPINSLVSKTIQRGIIEKGMDYNDEKFSKDMKDIALSISEEFPLTQFVNTEKVLSRNPAYSAMSKLFFNRDPYRQEQVVAFEEKTKDYLEGAQAGERQASEIFKKIGEGAKSTLLPEGISPKRLEAAASSIPFENNPFSGILIFATEISTTEKEKFEEKYGKNTLNKILSASGISQRFFKEGTKINQNLVDYSISEIKDRGEFREKMASPLLEKFDDLATKMTRAEAYKAVKKEFIEKEYSKLDPEQKNIARDWLEGEFKNIAKRDIKDPMIKQILGMTTSDAKLDAINETLKTIKMTDSSKTEFLRQLYDNGLMKSKETGKRLNQRGMRFKNNGEPNDYFEEDMGYIRDQILKYVEEKRSKQ